MGDNPIPPAIIAAAKLYAPKTPGDAPSIAIAQWQLETGHGKSELWRISLNPFGIKDARDDRFQVEGGGEHAAYASIVDAFKDRVRILHLYRTWAVKDGLNPDDVMGLLERWWAPKQQYRQKLRDLIRRGNLDQYDTASTTTEERRMLDVSPDPRDEDHPGQPRRKDVGHQGRGPSVLGYGLRFALPILLGVLLKGGGGGIISWFADLLGDVERDSGGDQPGSWKREEAMRRLDPTRTGDRDVLGPLIDWGVGLINDKLGTHQWGGLIAQGLGRALLTRLEREA